MRSRLRSKTKKTDTKCCSDSLVRLKLKVQKTLRGKSNELILITPKSWKSIKKKRNLKPKKTFLKLKGTFRFKIKGLKMRLNFRNRNKLICNNKLKKYKKITKTVSKNLKKEV